MTRRVPGGRLGVAALVVVAAATVGVVLALRARSGSPPEAASDAPADTAVTVPTDPGTPPPGCAGVDVPAGTPIQELVDANPERTTFCLRSGTWRMQSVTPKAGDTFVGAGEATVLNGSRPLSGFRRQGSRWYVDHQTQEGQVHGECWQVARCNRPEDLFVDDRPLLHVAKKSQLGPGKWYFDYHADRIYLGDDPTGHTVETSVTRHAFFAVAVNDVTIKDLVVEKYAQPAQFGAIQSGDFDEPSSSGWLVDGVTARLNHGTGIAFFGDDDSTIQNSKLLQNGQKGIGAAGRNIEILSNEIADNNYQRAFDPGWEAGGSKFSLTENLVVRGNDVHDNHGPGLWTDWNNVGTLYEDNRVVHNGQDGIFHEISYRAVIRSNTVEGNGFERQEWCYGAGITVSASSDVEVYGNTVKDNFNSISGVQQRRGEGPSGPYEIRNLYVHDNLVQGGPTTGEGSQVGPCEDYDAGVYTAGWNIRFEGNQYYGQLNKWVWHDVITDFGLWQSDGQDRGGAQFPDRTLS